MARATVIGAAAILLLHGANLGWAIATGLGGMPSSVQEAIRGIALHLLAFQLKLALACAAAGAVFGIVAHLCLSAVGAVATRSRVLAGVMGLCTAVCTRTLVHRPALFEDILWRKGGARGALQSFLADTVGVRFIDFGFGALLAAVTLLWLFRARNALARPVFLAALAAVIAVAAVALVPRTRKAACKGTSVVMLVADSLRADHLSSEGYPRATSPSIDALRAEGAFVKDLFVTQAITQPSFTSFLTGVYPHHHGVRDIFPRAEHIRMHLPTLPKILGERGYDTVVVGDFAAEMFGRMEFGFSEVDVPPVASLTVFAEREVLTRLPLALGLFTGWVGQRLFPVSRVLLNNADPVAVTSRVQGHLDRLLSSERPFFLVVFYSVVHAPFAPPMPDAAAFRDPSYSGPSRYSYELQNLQDIPRMADRPPDAEVEQVRALYDGAVRAFDREVGQIVARLDRDGLSDRIVIVAGDHGENLFEPGATTEHGKWFAGGTAAYRAPLIFSGTGIRKGDVDGLVSGVDLMPTLLERLRVPVPGGLDGVALFSEPRADRAVFAETSTWLAGEVDRPPDTILYPPLTELLEPEPGTYALVMKRRFLDVTVTAKMRAVRRGKWELVYTPTPTSTRLALFNLEEDRYAQRDVAAEHPEVVEPLRAELFAWMAQDLVPRKER
jgi:arylsulfatase A-like enzyme